MSSRCWLVDDLGEDTADRGEDVDGGIVVLAGEFGGEDDVAIENGADFVGDRFIEVVACDEDGIEGGDGAFVGIAGAFEKAGQDGEDRGGVAGAGGRLSCGQADFAKRSGKAGDRVHHQDDRFALVAEIFGDGCADIGGVEAHLGGLVGSGDDDDGSLHPFCA